MTARAAAPGRRDNRKLLGWPVSEAEKDVYEELQKAGWFRPAQHAQHDLPQSTCRVNAC